MPFPISRSDPAAMSEDDILKEAVELRIAIGESQGELAERNALARANETIRSTEHRTWLAGARKYQMLLQARLSRLRPFERKINIERNRTGKP